MDDTAPLGKPLPGHGHRRVTFPRHTRLSNAVKETGIVQAKQPKHVKANNESKITQAEWHESNHAETQGCNESVDNSKNYKFIKEG